MKLNRTTFACLLFFYLTNMLFAQAQTDGKVKIFLNSDDCPNYFIRQQIDQVSFVRDRKVADVHLFVTKISSAGGEEPYGFHFLSLTDAYEPDIKL
jgi:hypothetical protein